MQAHHIGAFLLLGVIAFPLLAAFSATAAIALLVVFLLAILTDRVVAFLVASLNRLSRRCRESLSAGTDQGGQSLESEQRSQELNEALSRLQRREQELSAAYDRRRCSEAELIFASSMRLQAEISLLRHRCMPKPDSLKPNRYE